MGYYTTYTLEVIDLQNKLNNTKWIKKELKEQFEFLDDDLEASELKWYSHQKDLKQFSLDYPDVLFMLTGIGEEHTFNDLKVEADIWIKYFLNGKCYTDSLEYTFPNFDITKLQ